MVARAVEVLEEDLSSADLKLRQQAAVHVLRASGLYGADLEPRGATEPEDVTAGWLTDAKTREMDRMLSNIT